MRFGGRLPKPFNPALLTLDRSVRVRLGSGRPSVNAATGATLLRTLPRQRDRLPRPALVFDQIGFSSRLSPVSISGVCAGSGVDSASGLVRVEPGVSSKMSSNCSCAATLPPEAFDLEECHAILASSCARLSNSSALRDSTSGGKSGGGPAGGDGGGDVREASGSGATAASLAFALHLAIFARMP